MAQGAPDGGTYPRIETAGLKSLLADAGTQKGRLVLAAYGITGVMGDPALTTESVEVSRHLIDAALQDHDREREQRVADAVLYGIPTVERRSARLLRRLGVSPIDLVAIALVNKSAGLWTSEGLGVQAHISQVTGRNRRLSTIIDLAPTVILTARPHEGLSLVVSRIDIPETIMTSLRGRLLSEVVEHPLLDPDLRILSASTRSQRATFVLDDEPDWVDALSVRPESEATP